MTDVAAVRVTNIVSVTQGSNVYKGVRSVNLTADKGKLLPILVEGDLYPSGAENVGMPEFPVTTQVVFETDSEAVLELMAESNADMVIQYKVAGGGANKNLTVANHEFRRQTVAQGLQDFGKPAVEGVAFSEDGSTIPMSVAAVV